MVVLHVKRGEESLFLVETVVTAGVGDVLGEVVHLHNAILKVLRLCAGECVCVCVPSLSPPFSPPP